MINLTVKTLDSRNHQFSVNDDMTVEEFKRHIADEVNISAETQRIIYCGRVLQDSSKLIDHDLDGKAVHLVQRPPPGTTPSNSSRSSRTSSPHPTHRMFRTLDTNNATVFLGSVYPSNLDTQGVLHPPTHTHAFTRLNVARRMLRRAEHLISQLENPAAPAEPAPQDDPQDEVLPIIEARLYYPGAHTAADESQIITQFFQNYLRRESQNSGNTNAAEPSTPNTSTATAPPSEAAQDTRFPENATRTAQLAEVLATLTEVQHRFAPFLERYQSFMRDDPSITSQEETRTVQLELDKVSEVMHYLSHAYHSLSDVILRVRNPPPRPLLTRPLMLQQSAFVQTRMGIPIQVEAQINLTDRSGGSSTTSQAPQTGESATPSTTAPTATPQSFSSQAVPMISTVRVPIPLDIAGFLPAQSVGSSGAGRETPAAGASNAGAAAASAAGASPSGNRSNSASTSTSFSSADPEVELIMEVTPEGISIDSLEGGVRSNQTEDFLRGGSINGQQPANFIHTMMQMATELINSTGRDAAASRQTSATSAPPLTPTPPAQNSQARGNNQTNPTSSTQTRSTPRPHVHLHHQNIPSGFDPYLPCHSHHVNRRRVYSDSTSTSAQNQSSPDTPRARTEERPNLSNDSLHGRLHGAVNRFLEQVGIGDAPQIVGEESVLAAVSESVPRAGGSPTFRVSGRGYNLQAVFGEFTFGGTYVSGESIFQDIVLTLYRSLSMRAILRINIGDYSPLRLVMARLRSYFFNSLALESGSPNTEIVERFIMESSGVLETMSRIPIWGDVDIRASLIKYMRAKLPDILELCARELERDTSEPALLFETVATAVKELGALVFRACNKNVNASDLVFRQLMGKHLRGLPEELLAWFAPNGIQFITDYLQRNSNLISSVESFIVLKKSENLVVSEGSSQTSAKKNEEEPMEVEEAQVELVNVEKTPAPVPKPEENVTEEPLPSVVNGSQPWHNQVPADWVPIINRDVQQQRKLNIQTPFSDAYLSGMPSKRRKIVHNSKVRHGIPLPQVIAESVKKAVSNTGLSGVAPLETVSRLAGQSQEIQTAYRTLLRTSVQEGLRDNSDFNPERFPNAASYFFPK